MNKNLIFRFSAMALLFSLVFVGCQPETITDTEYPADEKKTEKYSADVATRWMDLIMYLVKSEGKNPPQASRIYAYTSLALYEGVVPGMHENRSMSKQLNGLNYLPSRSKNKSYDFPTVANKSMRDVAVTAFGSLQSQNQAKVDSLYNVIVGERIAETTVPIYQNSVSFGASVGAAINSYMSFDNFTQTRSMVYTVPSRVGHPEYWAPTGATTMPAEPFWGQIRPFCMANGQTCFYPSNIPFSTDPSSAFYIQGNQVYTTSVNLTQEQKDIADFWADNAGQTATPPGHWVSICNQMAKKNEMDLGEAAEMYLLTGLAVADAFISCWEAKYRINLLRPQTYIRENIDPNWVPYLPTPPFPEYTSGHSVCSGAASEVLTQLLGTQAFTDSTAYRSKGLVRSFNSFYEAADEAAISRLYGGIHFQEAISNGVAQGYLVGQSLMNRIKLRK